MKLLMENWRKYLNETNNERRVFKLDGGKIEVIENSKWAGGAHSIFSFFVDEKKRGQGIGKKLIKMVIDAYPDEEISAQASSKASLKAFMSLGFVPAEKPNASYGEALVLFKNNMSSLNVRKNYNFNESIERKSAAGIKKAIKDLTQQGGNTGGNPTGMKAVKRPLGDKDEDEISAPPGAPGGGSIGHLEESEGSNTDDEKYFQWLIPLREIGTQALKDKENFKRMGSGGYRIVFYPLSDPTFVIKAAKNQTGVENNKKEHEANRLFPNIFPRTFAHAPNWHWIVSERVRVLMSSDNEGFDEMVEINFSRLRNYMYQNDFIRKTILDDSPPGGQAVFFHATQALMHGGGTEYSEFKTEFSKDLSDIYIKRNNSEGKKKAYDMMFRFAMKNEPVFFEIYKAYNRLKLEPADFGAGNIGVNEVGDLKILDASYFGD